MRILFICTGNVARSPTALAIARRNVKTHNTKNKLTFDSAGIKVFYDKEKPDSRIVKLGKDKNVFFENIFARQVTIKDFDNFDLILTMTRDHKNQLLKMPQPDHHPKIKLLLDFCKVENSFNDDVPDPYYGTSEDFIKVFGLIESAVDNLFKIINHKEWD